MTLAAMFKRLEEIDKRKGITELPSDHPVYSEPPSITFSSRTPKPSDRKAIVFPPDDLLKDLD